MVERAVLVMGAIAALLTASSPYWVPVITHRLSAKKADQPAPVVQGVPVDSYADDAIESERRRADEMKEQRDYWRDKAERRGKTLEAANRALHDAGLPPYPID